MSTVYSYLRFSRPEQMRGDSQRRQTDKARDWADNQGLPLDESLDLRDLGVSAFRGKNADVGALSEFIRCIESGKVKQGDVLAVESLDRLTREGIDEGYQLVRRILKAGVNIKTFYPDEYLTADDLGNLVKILNVLLILARANEESETKSKRLQAAWSNKRKDVERRKLTAIAPRWLRAVRNDDGKVVDFEPIPERVKIVQRIFRMAADGLGMEYIAKTLNGEQVPTFGKGKSKADFWQRSYIKKIMTNRAVLGEYQPHRMKDGKRVPCGDAIVDYFPAVVDEAVFYAVQRTRRDGTQRGRHANRVSNLFTGLLKDARDGSSLVLVDKSSKSHPTKGGTVGLVSSAARQGVPKAVYLSFPYDALEQSLLTWAWDLDLGDILPRKATNIGDAIQKAEGRLASIEHKLRKLATRMESADDFEALIDWKLKLEGDRKAEQANIERLKQENASKEGEALNRMKELLDKLGTASDDEVYRLRVKLRSTLKRLIDDVVVLVVQVNNDRLALTDIQFRGGQRRQVTIMPAKRITVPEGLEGLDIREWQCWPKAYRKTRFDVVTDEARHMMELEDSGWTRASIADELGCSVSHVSRTLRALGRKKGTKKAADHEWLMTWHPGGNGWVKRHKGQRYFIGMGELAQAYPRLVKERTPEGSWKAANRWWKAKLAEIDEPSAVCSR